MGVELVMELVSCGFAYSTSVVEPPALGRSQPTHVTLAEFAGARIVGGGVEPHRERASVEGERGGRGCGRPAAGART